jgi:hypothetical protein
MRRVRDCQDNGEDVETFPVWTLRLWPASVSNRAWARLRGCCAAADPSQSGGRIKTDRRDAAMLARLHRAAELTEVWVPDAAHEAMRDLV